MYTEPLNRADCIYPWNFGSLV